MLVPDESRRSEITAGKVTSGMLMLLIIVTLLAAGAYLVIHVPTALP